MITEAEGAAPALLAAVGAGAGAFISDGCEDAGWLFKAESSPGKDRKRNLFR